MPKVHYHVAWGNEGDEPTMYSRWFDHAEQAMARRGRQPDRPARVIECSDDCEPDHSPETGPETVAGFAYNRPSGGR